MHLLFGLRNFESPASTLACQISKRRGCTRPLPLEPKELIYGSSSVCPQVNVMLQALRAKFSAHEGPRNMLLASGTAVLVEAAPHDFVWGGGHNGSGTNMLGRLLMQVRDELRGGDQQ